MTREEVKLAAGMGHLSAGRGGRSARETERHDGGDSGDSPSPDQHFAPSRAQFWLVGTRKVLISLVSVQVPLPTRSALMFWQTTARPVTQSAVALQLAPRGRST